MTKYIFIDNILRSKRIPIKSKQHLRLILLNPHSFRVFLLFLYLCPAEDFAGKAAQIDRKDHLGK